MKMLQSDWLSIRALNNTINHECSEARLFDGRRVISVILDNVYLDWIQIAYLSVHGWIKPHCKRFLSGAPGFCLPRFFLVKIWSFLKSFAFMRISELRKLKTTIEPERKRKRASQSNRESRRKQEEPFPLPFFHRAFKCVTPPAPRPSQTYFQRTLKTNLVS